jgi:CheY-like chemotaxis protein
MIPPLLLVDDEEDDAFLFRLAAQEAGISRPILTAHSGEAALDLLAAEGVSPALIVLDIKMPGIDGLEVLRRLRADPAHKELPVVMLSGSDLESDREESMRLGCKLFLMKPDSLKGYAEVAARVKSLLP